MNTILKELEEIKKLITKNNNKKIEDVVFQEIHGNNETVRVVLIIEKDPLDQPTIEVSYKTFKELLRIKEIKYDFQPLVTKSSLYNLKSLDSFLDTNFEERLANRDDEIMRVKVFNDAKRRISFEMDDMDELDDKEYNELFIIKLEEELSTLNVDTRDLLKALKEANS